ncbi:hypothetical protein LMG28614_00465 [Paraburkholderia ultramafica]|uniref:HTH lysR-type domain-containing protein n=1 Tax=Paraburkholderia ultramafica TaxID=1544867 RepID=A0A6S7AUP8_9BURK|nr:hypothetical protein LMG28614_00465 [Paraburkholderia ultramafica]
MELRHLRYFMAAAETGSLTVAGATAPAYVAAVAEPPDPRSSPVLKLFLSRADELMAQVASHSS